MAGLKKSAKKDATSPNMVLVIFLILFILTNIGVGVFAYYGYDGQEKLRNDVKAAQASEKTAKEALQGPQYIEYLARLAIGQEPTPEDKERFGLISGNLENLGAAKTVPNVFYEQTTRELGWNAAEVKFNDNYPSLLKKAQDAEKAARAEVEKMRKEHEEYKTNYTKLQAKYDEDMKDLREKIKQANIDILKAAQDTNKQFPKIQDALVKSEDARKKQDEEHIKELEARDGQIQRLQQDKEDLKRKLDDRALGVAQAPAAGGGDLHALMLDISRGVPLWDKALGKILRVDTSNMLVYIDIGSRQGLKPDVSFNVFAAGPGGKADRQLKGTVEVVRIINDSTAAARITSLYNDKGESIPLTTELGRLRAVREVDSTLREGDLLFNTFFGAHVFIAGNVNFSGYASDSPSAQNLQLNEFIAQLRKMNVVVDGYINLLNGQPEGAVTAKTRLLIRGDMAPINRTQDEVDRFNAIKETYQAVKKQAMDQGMFIISAENFATVSGMRPATIQTGARDITGGFRPGLPFTGGQAIRRFDPVIEGPGGGAAPAPMPEPKKDEEKKDEK